MEPVQPLTVEDLEETYSPEILALVASAPERINSGYWRSYQDARDYLYMDKLPHEISGPVAIEPTSELQPTITNAPFKISKKTDDLFSRSKRTGPVLDQGQTPRCVCYSGSGLQVEHERREHRRTYNPNPDEWYARVKKIDPFGPDTDGTDIRSASQVLQSQGLYLDDPRSKKDDPGRLFTIGNYVRLTSVEQILENVKKRSSVWFGISVDKGIFTPLKTDVGWVVAPPDHQPVGGHAMLITGYWISQGWLQIKNSWGEGWGDKGYAWLPITHFMSYPDWDAWVTLDSKEILT